MPVRTSRLKRTSPRAKARAKSIQSQLDLLETTQLVRRMGDEESTYIFKHALVQDTAYESVLLRKRRGLHKLVAEAYEQSYPQRLDEFAALLEYHYAQAEDVEKTFEFATRAGDVSTRLSAYAEAWSHYKTALSALERLADTEENRRAKIETALKYVQVAWGIDSADHNLATLFQAEALARTLGDNERLNLARVHYWIGRMYSYRNEHPKAAQYYERVLGVAEEFNDQRLLGLALALGARTFAVEGYFGKSVPLFERAIPYLEKIGDWQEWVLAKTLLAISLSAQGLYLEGRRQGDETIQKVAELKDRGTLAIAHLMAARVEFMAGYPQQMLDHVRRWVKEAQATYPLVHYMALGFQAWAESRLGLHDAARATIAETNALANQFGTELIFADWFAAAKAEIEYNAGDIEKARTLAEQAVAYAESMDGIFAQGIAHRVWAQTLTPDQANIHFEASLRALEIADARIEAARTQTVWGRALQKIGHARAAQEHFEKAAAQFQESMLDAELAHVSHLLDEVRIAS